MSEWKQLTIDVSGVNDFAGTPGIDGLEEEALQANLRLHDGTGPGNDFLGWIDLPVSVTESISKIKAVAEKLRGLSETIIVIGIGGSYLGAVSIYEALKRPYHNDVPELIFAGHTLSEDYYAALLEYLAGRSFSVIVISKSGTTTEPAVAFRLLRNLLVSRYGKEGASERIVAVTDPREGALKRMALNEGWPTFDVPGDVGGRYSVLSPVGLLPLAVAGIDISELLKGAADMRERTGIAIPFEDNPAAIYAAARNALYRRGYRTEILAVYEPALRLLTEWWKQLFGESEGKQGKGIFPASVVNVTDLHSMGQYIQDGPRDLFETVISIARSGSEVIIPAEDTDDDGLNYLAGKRLGDVNRKAMEGVGLAHVDGGVPNIRIGVPQLDEYWVGCLLYFFEKACGISGYMLGINPFDQPGVEEYKKRMFGLLGKPGY